MRDSTRKMVLAAAVILATGQSARAGLILSINQVGADVVASANGSIDLTGLTFEGLSNNNPQLFPGRGLITMGTPTGALPNDIYSGITGPSSFGALISTSPTSGSGDVFLLYGAGQVIGVPVGYVSGQDINSTDTYSNATIVSLGLNTGTYLYTWGDAGPSQAVTVEVGLGVAAVPEPSTLISGGLAGLIGLGYAWRCRRAVRATA